MTLQQHFREAHGISLAYRDMFGIRIGNKDRKDEVYPAELCRIVAGQIYKKKASPETTKSAVTFATKRPQERLTMITSGVNAGGGTMRAPVSKGLFFVRDNLTTGAGFGISKLTLSTRCRDASSY